jgi:hypothetical protein
MGFSLKKHSDPLQVPLVGCQVQGRPAVLHRNSLHGNSDTGQRGDTGDGGTVVRWRAGKCCCRLRWTEVCSLVFEIWCCWAGGGSGWQHAELRATLQATVCVLQLLMAGASQCACATCAPSVSMACGPVQVVVSLRPLLRAAYSGPAPRVDAVARAAAPQS